MKTLRMAVVFGALLMLPLCRASGLSLFGLRWLEPERYWLTTDFEAGTTLRYRFVSHRDIALDWDGGTAEDAESVQNQSEHFEMVMALTPVDVDPFGASTIRVVCESVRMRRMGRPTMRGLTEDAVLTAQGRSFVIRVDPRGKIVDTSDLDRFIGDLGAAAFRADTSRGRIKEPDLIGDFVAGTWFLWDAIASIQRPVAGVTVGQTWPSKLPVPTPMVMRRARDVTYRLADVIETEAGQVAEIDSVCSLADSAPSSWPIPYSGRFQFSGTFGFLGGYEITSLEGHGHVRFNIDAGRLERQEQEYTLEMKASVPPMGIQANPFITIAQTLTTERVAE